MGINSAFKGLILAAAGPHASAAYRLENSRIISEQQELLHPTSGLRLMMSSHFKKYSTLQSNSRATAIFFGIAYCTAKSIFLDMAETDETQNGANIYLKAY
jgi:hypothetical protein